MNKLFIITILFFMFSTGVKSQNLLDEKNGFKSIQLNSSKFSFENISFLRSESDFDVFSYIPENSDIFNVFDVRMDKIILYFDSKSNLLKKIDIIKVFFNPGPPSRYKEATTCMMSIIDKYISLLGKSNEVVQIQNTSNSVLGSKWFGSNVMLTVTTVKYPIKSDDCTSEVHVTYSLFSLINGI